MEKDERGIEKEKEKVCKRCKQTFTSSSNTSSACRFHPSFFVCRRHDDQKRIHKAITGGGFWVKLVKQCLIYEQAVSGGYYELGPEDPPYAAKFYDCCGAEDPEASGCTTSFHVSYDD